MADAALTTRAQPRARAAGVSVLPGRRRVLRGRQHRRQRPPNFQAFALAERWNGKTWAIQHLPEPPGTGSSYLTGISCSSPVACTTVGEAVLGLPAGTVTLAERWNGTRWAIQHTPNPPHGNLPGVATATLNAVSCPSATTCVAVGRSDSGALAERWNGTTWAIQHLPG